MKEENNRKAIMVLISFGISIAFFIVLRVLGVVYLEDTAQEIVDLNVFSAFNLITWIGFLVIIGVSAAVLLSTLVTNRGKLLDNLIFSFFVVLVIISVISFIYVGLKFPFLFEGIGNDFQGYLTKFIRFPSWVSVFALDVFVGEPFWFWLVIASAYHGLLAAMLLIDIPDVFGRMKKERPLISKFKIEHFFYIMIPIVAILVTVILVKVLK
jgi:hypothetical protein